MRNRRSPPRGLLVLSLVSLACLLALTPFEFPNANAAILGLQSYLTSGTCSTNSGPTVGIQQPISTCPLPPVVNQNNAPCVKPQNVTADIGFKTWCAKDGKCPELPTGKSVSEYAVMRVYNGSKDCGSEATVVCTLATGICYGIPTSVDGSRMRYFKADSASVTAFCTTSTCTDSDCLVLSFTDSSCRAGSGSYPYSFEFASDCGGAAPQPTTSSTGRLPLPTSASIPTTGSVKSTISVPKPTRDPSEGISSASTVSIERPSSTTGGASVTRSATETTGSLPPRPSISSRPGGAKKNRAGFIGGLVAGLVATIAGLV